MITEENPYASSQSRAHREEGGGAVQSNDAFESVAYAAAMFVIPLVVAFFTGVLAGVLVRRFEQVDERYVSLFIGVPWTRKVFQEETVAFAALVDMTEKFVGDFAKPHKCDVSGTTTVGGKSLCCEVAAGEVANLVEKAMDDVKVTYLVGKESVCCPDAAKALAKKSGEKVVQLVAGQKCGGCSTTTRLNLARAKYKAAIEALLAADKKNSESSADGTSANATNDKITEVSAS